MRIELASFTPRGARLAAELAQSLNVQGDEANAYASGRCAAAGGLPPMGGVAAWTRERFDAADALVFVGAAGIAVRAIAPCLRSKLTDPAVVAVDEAGRYAVSLLSGHVGGANRLARRIAALTGGQAVVSTATDVNGRFSVDEWIARQGMAMRNPKAARAFAAALLEGRPVGLASEFPIAGGLPEGVRLCCAQGGADGAGLGSLPRGDASGGMRDLRGGAAEEAPGNVGGGLHIAPPGIEDAESRAVPCAAGDADDGIRGAGDPPDGGAGRRWPEVGLYIGIRRTEPFAQTVTAVPRIVVAGVGCRRGIGMEAVHGAVCDALASANVHPESLCAVASIDLKRGEAGLMRFCESLNLPAQFFSAEALRAVPGAFTSSERVLRVTGVDNVCERAAVAAGGRLILRKYVRQGVTVALASRPHEVRFEDRDG